MRNEDFEESLFELDTTDNSPEFKAPSESVYARNEDDIPVSLDPKSKAVLVGDYSKTY